MERIEEVGKGKSYIASHTVAAVAAKKSMSCIVNPASSGIYVVITKLYATLAAAGICPLAYHTVFTGMTDDSSGKISTTMIGSGGTPVTKLYHDAEAAPGGTAVGEFYVSTVPTEIEFHDHVVLYPGYGLCINDPVVNQAMTVQWHVTEYTKPSDPSSY